MLRMVPLPGKNRGGLWEVFMALFFADLVREFSSSAGAGDFVLAGAVPGHRGFAGVVPAAARFHYCIAGVTHPAEWEVGEGEIGSGGTLVRAPTVSSAGGELVDFAPGLKTVALTVAADWFAAQDHGVAIANVAGLEAALAGKAAAAHEHDAAYAPVGHDHDAVYARAVHDHDAVYAPAVHDHDAVYAPAVHDHDAAYAPVAHGHAFADLSGRPTTLAGYGITDAAAAAHHHDGVYQPLAANLSSLAGLSAGADQLAYATGAGSWALSGLSAFGRSLIDDADAEAGRATLGLGSSATQPVGTSGAAVPLLSNANAWTLEQRLNGGAVSSRLTVSFADANGSGNGLAFAGDANNAWCMYLSDAGRTGQGPRAALTAPAGTYVTRYALRSVVLSPSVVAGTGWTFEHVTQAGASPVLVAELSASGTLRTTGQIVGASFAAAGTQVVGARRTGWTAASGTAARTSFDAASVTTAELAKRVKALIDDLMAHGLIGS